MSRCISEFKEKFRFLSNFYYQDIEFDGDIYPTSEHFFQAVKSEDIEIRAQLRALPTPGKAKRMGRSIELREDWEEIKDTVMYIVVFDKFTQSGRLQTMLINLTAGYELVEGNNWHDNYWGDCMCDKCKDIVGQNKLGKILMKVRDEIAEYNEIEPCTECGGSGRITAKNPAVGNLMCICRRCKGVGVEPKKEGKPNEEKKM